ncbi:hypothetical protein BG000_007078, partial [Podila horticola]
HALLSSEHDSDTENNNNEILVEDLKVMEQFEEEADDEDDGESIEDLVLELEELIEKTEPGFHPLIKALYHAVRSESFEKPQERPSMSESQAFLYNFVWERLDKFSTLPPIEQKDT